MSSPPGNDAVVAARHDATAAAFDQVHDHHDNTVEQDAKLVT
jgi:hypothetical protein